MISRKLQLYIPEYVLGICNLLRANGYQAYVVGGAIRDALLKKRVKDFDVATDALPERVEALFRLALPTGKAFGTITVVEDNGSVEITTFRRESLYSDKRRPDKVFYSTSLQEDLSRRDFTINALAYDPLTHELHDFYHGLADLERGIIRTVGDPAERLREDALRMLRAVRFAATLTGDAGRFLIEPATRRALFENHHRLAHISAERIRDEINRMLLAGDAVSFAFEELYATGLLKYSMPELIAGVGVEQPHHCNDMDVFRHSLQAVGFTENRLELRLAALLHDVGKPFARNEYEGELHFFRHEEFSVATASHLLRRLRYSNAISAAVVHLIKYHMEIAHLSADSEESLRRLITKVGSRHMEDLLAIHRADLLASARREEAEARYEQLLSAILRQRESKAAFTIADLAIDGWDVMETLDIAPGPQVGEAIERCHELVMERPELNNREDLLRILRETACRHP